MQESIKQLLGLQDRDLEIDRLQIELAAVPKEIAKIKSQMDAEKAALESSKKDLTQAQMQRKNKENDLATKEEAVRKHTAELNLLKSNDSYRAMLGEIEKAKQEKAVLEDEILLLMEKVDQTQHLWKERESTAKSVEGERQQQIAGWDTKQKNLEEQIAQKQKERTELASTFPKASVSRYEQLRSGKKNSAVIVPLRGEQCAGCHMRVSQNLVNEVKRGQTVMYCEHCSRIVYLEEALAKP